MESTRKPPEPERPRPDATGEEPPSKPALEESQADDGYRVIRRAPEDGPTAYVFTGVRRPTKPAPADTSKEPS
jgi:hypothetical protein